MIVKSENGGELRVEYPRLTPQHLIKLTEAGELIERSDHVGNQHISALMTITDPRIKVRQMLVDTTNGNDREYRPRHVKIFGQLVPICPDDKQLLNVRHLRFEPNTKSSERLSHLPTMKLPNIGEPIVRTHQASLKKVSEGKSTVVTLTDVIGNNAETSTLVMGHLSNIGLIKRSVTDAGRILHLEATPSVQESGIFGINDSSGPYAGTLLPLEGMMALDLVLAARAGVDDVFHQAGCDMRLYTKDTNIMTRVASVAAATLIDLGISYSLPTYHVVDTTNMAKLASVANPEILPTSQYDEIIMRNLGCKGLQFADEALDQPLYT